MERHQTDWHNFQPGGKFAVTDDNLDIFVEEDGSLQLPPNVGLEAMNMHIYGKFILFIN